MLPHRKTVAVNKQVNWSVACNPQTNTHSDIEWIFLAKRPMLVPENQSYWNWFSGRRMKLSFNMTFFVSIMLCSSFQKQRQRGRCLRALIRKEIDDLSLERGICAVSWTVTSGTNWLRVHMLWSCDFCMRSSCQASLRYSSVAVQSIRDRPSSIVDLEIDPVAYWRKGENVFIKKLLKSLL